MTVGLCPSVTVGLAIGYAEAPHALHRSNTADLDASSLMEQLCDPDSGPSRIRIAEELSCDGDEDFGLSLNPKVIGVEFHHIGPTRTALRERGADVTKGLANLGLRVS